MNNNRINISNSMIWQLFFTLCFVSAILSLPLESMATAMTASQSAGGIASTMCKITKSLTGPIGKAVATIAVVVLGIGLFLGKLSWGLAIATAMGIGLIFSASSIVNWLGGSNAQSCSS
jgi:type IV secretory pathway VirB2 component (pilin)